MLFIFAFNCSAYSQDEKMQVIGVLDLFQMIEETEDDYFILSNAQINREQLIQL